MLIYNEIVTALILASVVALLVALLTPKGGQRADGTRPSRIYLACRAFVLAFIIVYAIVYFSGESDDEVMKHMIQGEPDF